MIVDILLRVLGENPAGYPKGTDKISLIIAGLLFHSTIYLSYILFILTWIWFFWHRKRGGIITKKKITITIVVSVFLFWFGSQLPWWIIEIIGGFAVRGMYGGQI